MVLFLPTGVTLIYVLFFVIRGFLVARKRRYSIVFLGPAVTKHCFLVNQHPSVHVLHKVPFILGEGLLVVQVSLFG